MSNSQKWAIWVVIAAVAFLICAASGGPWLRLAINAAGRIGAGVAILVVVAGVASVFQAPEPKA